MYVVSQHLEELLLLIALRMHSKSLAHHPDVLLHSLLALPLAGIQCCVRACASSVSSALP
jgi:hypothetical protein